MEMREWALRIFSADCLEEKLVKPPGGLKALTDHSPGSPVAWKRPPRSAELQIAPKKKRKRIPHPQSLHREDMRVRCLHAFANHELMALELMAWALLAFPDAEPNFRKGLANILMDEQRHFQLYAERLEAMGTRFGELPINDHFWRAAKDINNPLDWVCTMHLTFEQANLDHAPYFSKLFRQVDDEPSADLMQLIFEDEMRHVNFGTRWLKHYQPEDQSMFEVYAEHCSEINSPFRAKGPEFQEEARLKAGLDQDFIRSLKAWEQHG